MSAMVPRREALRLAVLAAAAPSALALATSTGTARAAARMMVPLPQNDPPVPGGWIVKPFANSQVTLGTSLFTANRDRILTFLRAYPADRMLANFRANAGLDTLGAQPPGGWDDATGNLRGHYSGHFLSALALAYAGSGDAFYKNKVDYMVTALGECQNALAAKVGQPGGPSHPGFLAAYPETQFIQLEQYATYPTIWAPYYTCHMIMRGLLDAYQYAGNEQALEIVLKMGDWVHSRLGHLPRAQLDRMWGIYIAGEYNGMNIVMADLYALTGKAEYLATATCFDNTALLAATADGQDTLNRKHANQHIPQFIGYLSVFDQNQERRYFDAAVNFWDMVVPHRVFTDGGLAGPADNGELFGARDVIVGTLGTNNAETCCNYNMLKLSRALFFHTADPKYMQYYERALYGQILASRRNTDSTTNPLLTYFIPMRPGAARTYGNLGTCCGGTGLESHTKFQDSIYFRSADDSTLYVNLYLASELDWAEKGFVIKQVTNYPADPAGVTTLTVTGNGRLVVKLRVPYWVEKGFTVLVNATDQRLDAKPGEYVTLDRQWRSGDTVRITMPFSLRIEKALDSPTTQSIAYGPVPMVAKSDQTTYRQFSFYKDFTLSGDLARAVTSTGPMSFTANGLPLVPLYLNNTDRYHAYFRRVEPTVVFGRIDSGVPNRERADSVTFLDAVWKNAPFANQGQFVSTVTRTAEEWVAAGLMTSAQKDTVVSTATRARLPSR
ncbi:glycoside hydrolase family 127 protein [Nonomuraea angiospora]|uniref:glycoside hydrolase family 127 protein n=1 Tax=Nonomuraea angiospora TaxID=46172 RepID=UPI0029A31105|nr:beta-L-arabinofuranosidase domain-containing protein [Nonomuraea angiospora]MDX3105337.1 glycoside hydrolase family 127 protein [Nonomuraea angiospora]